MGPLPEPWNSQLCYRALRELLTEASKGHNWTWCEVCPDAIVSTFLAVNPFRILKF